MGQKLLLVQNSSVQFKIMCFFKNPTQGFCDKTIENVMELDMFGPVYFKGSSCWSYENVLNLDIFGGQYLDMFEHVRTCLFQKFCVFGLMRMS